MTTKTKSFISDNQQLFKKVDCPLSALISDLEGGEIGLPDIQRPFVWNSSKVRDLLDSMFKGYPVGYFLFWQSGPDRNTRFVGTGQKRREHPNLLIIDGQQRLTSLYAVFSGIAVLDANYKETHIIISFCPLDASFMVASAATAKDPNYISNVTEALKTRQSYSVITQFISRLEEKRLVSNTEKELIASNINRLFALYDYPFTVLEIAYQVDEEDVADIFVRINSKGVSLNQSDFILTLLSVFREKERVALEAFCKEATIPSNSGKASPYNHFISPKPDDLLRTMVAYGFHRGTLKTIYQILRGKDLRNNTLSPQERDVQFDRLSNAQSDVLNLTSWHNYFSALIGAGYRSHEMLTSDVTLMYCYAFYLIGRNRFKIEEHKLQRLIGKWFFACSLTSRYVGSFESQMESDMASIEVFEDKVDTEAYIQWIEKTIASKLTPDYWNITLPSLLETASARTPMLFAFFAAQNNLDAKVLFSHKKISSMLDPVIKQTKKSLEKHHLFPKAYLASLGIDDRKAINQIANYALLEWPDNISVSDTAPHEYVPTMRARVKDAADWNDMCRLHALPDGWEQMDYREFLEKRRNLMADVIRRGYEKIS